MCIGAAIRTRLTATLALSRFFGDGVLWMVKWKVLVDPHCRMPLHDTDQRAYRSQGVRYPALLIKGSLPRDVDPGAVVALGWDPLVETHPGAPRPWESRAGNSSRAPAGPSDAGGDVGAGGGPWHGV